jgi:hypothetical protein
MLRKRVVPLMNHFVQFFSTQFCGNDKSETAGLPVPVAADCVVLDGLERMTLSCPVQGPIMAAER